MARIPLTSGFQLIPEGTYVFKITKVVYKEDFGKMEVSMETQDGMKHTERFSLFKSDGEPNEGAMNAFSFFAKTAMNDFSLEDIDPQELVGCFMECDFKHDEVESNRQAGKMVTFVRLDGKRPSEGFTAKTTETPKKKPPVNLDDLLG